MNKEELALSCVNLARKYARSFSLRDGDYDEWESCAMFGLAKAVNTYDESRGLKFITVAGTCIMNELRQKYLKDKKKATNETYLEEAVGRDDSGNCITLGETIEVEEEGFQNVIKEAEYSLLYTKINRLNPKEKYVITHYFGIGCEKINQKEIAKRLNMTRSNASRVVIASLEKLRRSYSYEQR